MVMNYVKVVLFTAVVAMVLVPVEASSTSNLTVLVQNMQFLFLAGGANDAMIERANKYGDYFADLDSDMPDVIGFTETFQPDPTTDLLSKLQTSHPHQLTNLGTSVPGKFIDSGLSLISKYPILKSEFRAYTECTGIDCFSAKGVLVAVIELPRSYAVVSVCHQNAGGTDEVMTSQLKTSQELLTEFVAASIPSSALAYTAVISMGDYNIASDATLYAKMIEILSDETLDPHKTLNPGEDGFTIPVPSPTRRLDYIFNLRSIGDGSCVFPAANAITYDVDTLVATNGSTLSDHYGVKAKFSVGDMPGVDDLPALVDIAKDKTRSCNADFFKNGVDVTAVSVALVFAALGLSVVTIH